ncbi:hypothetical protein ColTof3_01611 [Colletotrichum tofieldiae]|nr:hypothetical protein ColTof3_01611 [Colletotrichum tofieldiae]
MDLGGCPDGDSCAITEIKDDDTVVVCILEVPRDREEILKIAALRPATFVDLLRVMTLLVRLALIKENGRRGPTIEWEFRSITRGIRIASCSRRVFSGMLAPRINGDGIAARSARMLESV